MFKGLSAEHALAGRLYLLPWFVWKDYTLTVSARQTEEAEYISSTTCASTDKVVVRQSVLSQAKVVKFAHPVRDGNLVVRLDRA